MASIIREVTLRISVEEAWRAVNDVGSVHLKLAPGIVKSTTLAGRMRHIVFASGLEIDEAIVGIDEVARRLAYAVQERAEHHQASMQLFPQTGNCCRLVWITDVLPDDAAGRFSAVMDQALPVIKATLEAGMNQGGIES